MSSSTRRSRFRNREIAEVTIVDGDDHSVTEGETDSSSGDDEAELQSMAGKGIKRLCSELLELKKASDNDFQKNVYSNHSSFVRIFKEVGSMESELVELKQHVSTQRKLVQVLLDNLCSEIVADQSIAYEDEQSDDLDLWSPVICGYQMDNVLEKLDILLSEHQVEEALVVLERETETLQKLKDEEDHTSTITMSYMSAISERRTRLAEHFASVAEHPRVAAAELQRALSRLCRLGETHRANKLLIQFYRSYLANSVHQLESIKPSLHGTYIMELAKIVFSTISQVARSFVKLYGETSPYTSELITWAREEIETLSHKFDKYIRSISETSGGLSLAVEAVKTALSYCSLLTSQRIVLHPDLVKFMRPSMEEVLQMHLDHFKKVIGTFTATDNWVLGKFLISGILRDKPPLTADSGKLEYCLLTSSGRQFVTLVQAIVGDISSLSILQMESSILKGLADLFNAYMQALERAIPHRGNAVENDHPRISSAQRLPQQISLLVSSSTLVHLFPSVAASVFKGNTPSSNHGTLDHVEFSSYKEFDIWMMSIQDAADQLKAYFRQQFVFEVLSYRQSEQEIGGDSCSHGQCIPSSTEDLMPSFSFQALFSRLQQLGELSKSVLSDEEGIVEELVTELLTAVIARLSNEQEFWNDTKDCSVEHSKISSKQFLLDIHFLVEIAKHGGCSSDDLMNAAEDLTAQMEVRFSKIQSESNGVVPDDEWASTAAQLAIDKLLKVNTAEPQLRTEPVLSFIEEASTQNGEELVEVHAIELQLMEEALASFGEEVTAQNGEDASPANAENATITLENSSELKDCQSEGSIETDIAQLIEIESVESESVEGPIIGERIIDYDAPETDSEAKDLSKTGGIEEADAEGSVTMLEDGFLVKLDEPQQIAESESQVETKLLEGSDKLDAIVSCFKSEESADVLEDCDKYCLTDALICSGFDRSLLDSQIEGAELSDEESSVMLGDVDMSDFISMSQSSLTTSMELVQDDGAIVRDATTMREAQGDEIEELAGKNTELDLENSSDKEGEGAMQPSWGSRNTSSNSVRMKDGRERFRYVSPGEVPGKNRRPSITSRQRWH